MTELVVHSKHEPGAIRYIQYLHPNTEQDSKEQDSLYKLVKIPASSLTTYNDVVFFLALALYSLKKSRVFKLFFASTVI